MKQTSSFYVPSWHIVFYQGNAIGNSSIGILNDLHDAFGDFPVEFNTPITGVTFNVDYTYIEREKGEYLTKNDRFKHLHVYPNDAIL